MNGSKNGFCLDLAFAAMAAALPAFAAPDIRFREEAHPELDAVRTWAEISTGADEDELDGIDIPGIDKKMHDAKAAGNSGGVAFRPFQIPLRSCRAKDADNLFMAGRCISGDFYAQASYRVTGSAVALGEAVGKAAAGGER